MDIQAYVFHDNYFFSIGGNLSVLVHGLGMYGSRDTCNDSYKRVNRHLADLRACSNGSYLSCFSLMVVVRNML